MGSNGVADDDATVDHWAERKIEALTDLIALAGRELHELASICGERFDAPAFLVRVLTLDAPAEVGDAVAATLAAQPRFRHLVDLVERGW